MAAEQPFVVEYYYRVKWGHADEFLRLFRKNHYPVLKRQIESGRLLAVSMEAPQYHMPGAERWEYKVRITFRNVALATAPFDETAIKRELYPDWATFQAEEQRRFEILEGHWDVPLTSIDLEPAG